MKSLRALGVGATLVSAAQGIGAAALAEPIGELNPVVVSATADSLTQASLQSARDNLKTVPGGVWVEDLDSAREGRQSTWRDSLGLVPGVYIQDRFGSEESRISIRGSALSRTYHSFGIKVLQDGVPINYADGFFDMLTVDANAARYVEVLRGPNATTYGATTLGGAIHFVSPTGSSQPGSVVRTEAGSFGYQKLFGSTAGVIQNDREGARCGTITWRVLNRNSTGFATTPTWRIKNCWPTLARASMQTWRRAFTSPRCTAAPNCRGT